MTALLLTTLSPFMAWGLWAGLTFVVAWFMCRGNDVMEWILGL